MSIMDDYGMWGDQEEVINPQAEQVPQQPPQAQPRPLQVETVKNNQLPYQPTVPLENLVQPVQDFPEGSQQWEQNIIDKYGMWDEGIQDKIPFNPELPDIRTPSSLQEVKGGRTGIIQSIKTGAAMTFFNNPADRVESLKIYMGENYVDTKIDELGNIIITARDGKGDNHDYFVDAPDYNKKDWGDTLSKIAVDLPNFGANFVESLPAMRAAQLARGLKVFNAAKLATSAGARAGQLAATVGAAGATDVAVNYVVQDLTNGRTTPSRDTLLAGVVSGGSEFIGPLFKLLSTNPKALASLAATTIGGVDISSTAVLTDIIQGGLGEAGGEAIAKSGIIDWLISGAKNIGYKVATIGKNQKVANELFETLNKTDEGRTMLSDVLGDAFGDVNQKALFTDFLNSNKTNINKIPALLTNIPVRYRKVIQDAAEEALADINKKPMLASYIAGKEKEYKSIINEFATDPKLTKKWNDIYGRELNKVEKDAIFSELIDNGFDSLQVAKNKNLIITKPDINLEFYKKINKAQKIIDKHATNKTALINNLKKEGYSVNNLEELDSFVETYKNARQQAEDIIGRKININAGKNPFMTNSYDLSEKLFKVDINNADRLNYVIDFKKTVEALPAGSEFLQTLSNRKLLSIVDTAKTTDDLITGIDSIFPQYELLMRGTKDGEIFVNNVRKLREFMKSSSATKQTVTPIVEAEKRTFLQKINPLEGITNSKLYSQERKALFDALTTATYDITDKFGTSEQKMNALANIIRFKRLNQLDNVDEFGRNIIKVVGENINFQNTQENKKQLEERLRPNSSL